MPARVEAGDPFEWDSASTAVDDGVNVIIPDDITHPAPGRWLIVGKVFDVDSYLARKFFL